MSHPRTIQVRRGHEADAARDAASVLRSGALIVMPTDTVYGLAADARHPGAIERIAAAKGRDRDKPIPLLASGLDDAVAFGATLSPAELQLCRHFWPGPLTLVLNVGDRTEGFRVPDHPLAIAVIRAAGGALRVTSANLSGEPPALTAADARRLLERSVDLILDAGPSPGGAASTVARLEGDRVRILREGPINAARLEAACRTP